MTPSKRALPPPPRPARPKADLSTRSFVPPYAASWIDHLTDWVDRLPMPWWLFYMLMALLFSGLVALVLWRTGVYAAVGFHPLQIWLPSLPAYLLGLVHGLDRSSVSAMQRFRPAFRGDDRAFASAVYRMTTLPARPGLVFPVAATLVSLPFGPLEFSQLQTGGLDSVPGLFIVLLAPLYFTAYVFFYHTWHQLREIHHIHLEYSEVHLARIRPLYSLSQVTALTALGVVIINYGWLLAQPGLNLINWASLVENGFLLMLALVVFVWPLWGAHRLLTEAKEARLADVAARKEFDPATTSSGPRPGSAPARRFPPQSADRAQ